MMIKKDTATWQSSSVSKKTKLFSRGQFNIAKSFLINNLRVSRRVYVEIRMCRTHIRIYTPGESPLYEIPGGGGGGVEGWYTLWLKKEAEKRTARIKWHGIEEVSRIFAFRNAADAIYENVVREWCRGRAKKRTFSRKGERKEEERENCLFYGVELRRTILSPTKWPGSIFGSLSSPLSPSLPPRTPFSLSFFLCHVFFLFSFFARTPFSPCVFHEQHKFPPEKSTAQWHASTLIFFYPPLLNQARESYYGSNSIIVSCFSKNTRYTFNRRHSKVKYGALSQKWRSNKREKIFFIKLPNIIMIKKLTYLCKRFSAFNMLSNTNIEQ